MERLLFLTHNQPSYFVVFQIALVRRQLEKIVQQGTRNMWKFSFNFLLILCSGLSVLVLSINISGFFLELRPKNITSENLRFGEQDVRLSPDEFKAAVIRQGNESDIEYSKRLTEVIADGTAHIHWEKYEPNKFNQLVPIWENWILHVMGRYSGIPEFERYHFSSPFKSMERGIGICGDASMVMTQLLERNGIQASMLTFPGHVVVTAKIDNETLIFDPDFGVVIPASVEKLNSNVFLAKGLYASAGYTDADEAFFQSTYNQPYEVWDGPEHFIRKKYYFEKFAYAAKWGIPIVMLCFVMGLIRYSRNKKKPIKINEFG